MLAGIPQMLADLDDGRVTGGFTEVGGTVFFAADSEDSEPATDLWKTDGTVDGTVKVTTVTHPDLSPYAYLGGLVNANGVLAFVVFDGCDTWNDETDDRVQLWKSDGTEAGTQLVWDFGAGSRMSSTGGSYLTAVGGAVFGVLRTDADGPADTGYELFYSDLDETNSLGTHLVKDINPGPDNSYPTDLFAFDGKLYFAAADGDHGKELWVSDGNASGTQMVANLKGDGLPVDFGSYPSSLTAGDGEFFFGVLDFGADNDPATVADNHVELWQSDGATAGLIHAFEAGTMPPGGGYGWQYSESPELTYVPETGKLFGVVEFGDAVNRSRDLVCWDGNDMHQWDLNPTGNAWVGNLSPAFGGVAFGADDGVHGRELWRSDGDSANSAGTFMIQDLYDGGDGFDPAGRAFPVVDGDLYFPGKDGVHGVELWRSDGTEPGTELVADLNPTDVAYGDSYPEQLMGALAKLFFVPLTDGQNWQYPWVLDPNAPGTDFGDLDAPYPTLAANDGARHEIVFGFHLGKLIDGELDGQPSANADGDGADEDGLVLASPFRLGQLATFEMTVTDAADNGGFLDAWIDLDRDGVFEDLPSEHFLASEPVFDGVNELSVPLPLQATAGPTAFRFRLSSTGGLAPTGAAADGEVEDYLLTIEDGNYGNLGDPVPQPLVELNPGGDWSWASEFTEVGDVVFFVADSENSRTDLWKTDGTQAGTVKVTTVTHESLGPYAYMGDLINADGVLAFGVFDDDHVQLWKSDGTSAGTQLVWDFGPGSSQPYSHGAYLTAVGGSVFGMLRTGTGDAEADTGYELFYSDLDETNSLGTYLVKDINPGPDGSYPGDLLAFDGKLYFAANDGLHGRELWVSDGTPEGTQMVANIKGAGLETDFGSYPTGLTAADDVFYFGVLDPGPDNDFETIEDNHAELWQSDGTTTGVVYTFEAGTSPPRAYFGYGYYGYVGDPELTYVPETGKLFGVVEFADDAERSQDLVCWDGTNMHHWDLNPGGNDWVANLSPAFGLLGFAADDGTHGREPWLSDGNSANPDGTFMIKDIAPGEAWGVGLEEVGFDDFPVVGGYVYFPANDGAHGIELWRSNGSQSGTTLVADLAIGKDNYYYYPYSSRPSQLTAALGKLFFTTYYGENDPWVLDPDATEVKSLQEPDLTPNGIDIRLDSTEDRFGTLADDFLCTEPGLLTNIRFWGSWLEDIKPDFTTPEGFFYIHILSDDPVGAGGSDPDNTFSKPDEFLDWGFVAFPDQFVEQLAAVVDDGEWFWDPVTGTLVPQGDRQVWQYDIAIPPDLAFLQAGTAADPTVYWLEIEYMGAADYQFGWKTRDVADGHYNSDAVFGTVDGEVWEWSELKYPPGHPSAGQSIDLAFGLSFLEAELDWGDAPDPAYPTLSTSEGAFHVIEPGFHLGQTIDVDADGQPTAGADGDDTDAGGDDEDGVVFLTPLIRGSWAELTVSASAPGLLNAWIDWNCDGDCADADEQVVTDCWLAAGANDSAITVPESAKATKPTAPTFARFRFSTAGGLSYNGLALDGEVEDYPLIVKDGEIYVQAATADGGTTLSVTYVIAGMIPAFDFGFFLSPDPVLDPSDTPMDTATISDPADLSVGVHTKTFTIGTGAGEIALPGAGVAETEGEYYLLVVADPEDAVEEPDADPVQEDNTVAFSGVYHPPGGEVYVHGTLGDDVVAVWSGSLQLVVDGVPLSYDLATVTGLRVRGHAGDDQLGFDAGGGFAATPPLPVYVHGGAGSNRLYLWDSTGDDVLKLYPTRAVMSGPGYVLNAEAASRIEASAAGGGNDDVRLYDSAADDRLVSRAAYVYLEGAGFYNYVQGFGEVSAYATAGGLDKAQVFDSAGDDKFVSRAASAYIEGPGYFTYMAGFDEVSAYATVGGTDTAILFDTAGDDRFISRRDYSYMQGPGYLGYAAGFETVSPYATAGGVDTAVLFDSPGDDLFVGQPGYAYLEGPGFLSYVAGFDEVTAYATAGGTDKARFFDGAGDDVFVHRPTTAYIRGAGFYHYVQGFGDVKAYATAGGVDRAMLFDSAGNDKFVGRPNYSYLEGPGYLGYVAGFAEVKAYSTAGGTDTAMLFDSAGDDVFVGRSAAAYLQGPGYLNYASGFGSVSAYATAGGTDEALLFDSAGDDHLTGAGNWYELSYDLLDVLVPRPTKRSWGQGFDRVVATSNQGGYDTLDVEATDYLFEQFEDWQ